MNSLLGVVGWATLTVDTVTSRSPGSVVSPGSSTIGLVSPLCFLSMILLYSSSSSLLTLSKGFFAYGDLNTVAWCWKSLWMMPLLAAPIFIPPYPSTWLVWASCMFFTSSQLSPSRTFDSGPACTPPNRRPSFISFWTFLNSFGFVLTGTNWLLFSILVACEWDGDPSDTHLVIFLGSEVPVSSTSTFW